MRYERKYRITHLHQAAVEQAIRLHPAGFRKIFPDRQVNNIYFDTVDYQTFQQNIAGINQRKKYRIRWYGADSKQVYNSQFEIKIKHNELGRKEVIKLADIDRKSMTELTQQINQHTNQLLQLSPTLLNTYQRSYWGTTDGRFRITIDWDLHFYPPLTTATFSKQSLSDRAIIIELKYDEGHDELARAILQHLPFRQTKNSKYVTGILLHS
ncbi:MAG: polyphosphate polymerase domain-containing protein [Bacteroidota bacterium]